MSDRIRIASPSLMRPIAIPATGALMGTPASISDRVAPQTVAMDDEPFDSRISDTTRTVCARQDPDLAGDWPDILQAAAVDPASRADDGAAHHSAFHLFTHPGQGLLVIGELRRQGAQHLFFRLSRGGGAFMLAGDLKS